MQKRERRLTRSIFYINSIFYSCFFTIHACMLDARDATASDAHRWIHLRSVNVNEVSRDELPGVMEFPWQIHPVRPSSSQIQPQINKSPDGVTWRERIQVRVKIFRSLALAPSFSLSFFFSLSRSRSVTSVRWDRVRSSRQTTVTPCGFSGNVPRFPDRRFRVEDV